MKNNKRSLIIKMIFTSLFTLFVSGILTRISMFIITGSAHTIPFNEDNMFWVMIIIMFISLSLFAILVNKFLVRRIKNVDNATLKIKDGDYDFSLEVKGNDEISNLSENFNLMLQELKSNEYLNKEFVRNFSHEFKTPLSVIRGYAELIESGDLTKVEQAEYLNIIISESERLSHLTNNMLQISLIDSKAIIKKEDEYSFTEQIRNVIQMTQLKWEEKQLTFNLDMEEIIIKNNKELTYQILLNLLSNAVKYSNLKEEIKISLTNQENTFTFSITNKGQQIPKEDFDKIFNLFYVANKEHNNQSTGVGLTLTKKIIDKLKGEISFDSNDGITTFHVVLSK